MTTAQSAAQQAASNDAGAGAGQKSVEAEAKDALSDVRSDVEDLIDRATEEASKLKEAATEYGSAFARERKLGAADSIVQIAGGLRDVGARLEDSPNLRALADDAARNLEEVAESIRTRSFGDLMSDAESFARQRPLTVAAGAAICGLLVARFVRSSGTRTRYSDRDTDDRYDYRSQADW